MQVERRIRTIRIGHSSNRPRVKRSMFLFCCCYKSVKSIRVVQRDKLVMDRPSHRLFQPELLSIHRRDPIVKPTNRLPKLLDVLFGYFGRKHLNLTTYIFHKTPLNLFKYFSESIIVRRIIPRRHPKQHFQIRPMVSAIFDITYIAAQGVSLLREIVRQKKITAQKIRIASFEAQIQIEPISDDPHTIQQRSAHLSFNPKTHQKVPSHLARGLGQNKLRALIPPP